MRNSITTSLFAVLALSIAACNTPASASPAAPAREAAPVGATAAPEANVVSITVNADGFSPGAVHAEKGKKLTLRFTRTSDETCAKQVDFPELGMKRELPLDQPVDIDVPAAEARTIGFQCGMGMYKSSVVIH